MGRVGRMAGWTGAVNVARTSSSVGGDGEKWVPVCSARRSW